MQLMSPHNADHLKLHMNGLTYYSKSFLTKVTLKNIKDYQYHSYVTERLHWLLNHSLDLLTLLLHHYFKLYLKLCHRLKCCCNKPKVILKHGLSMSKQIKTKKSISKKRLLKLKNLNKTKTHTTLKENHYKEKFLYFHLTSHKHCDLH